MLNGSKTWTSNNGIRDFYVTFAKSEPDAGTRGMAAFIVDAETAGLDNSQHIAVLAPHPLATGVFDHCQLPPDGQLGALNCGIKLALRWARRAGHWLRPSHLPSTVPCLVSAWPTSC